MKKIFQLSPFTFQFSAFTYICKKGHPFKDVLFYKSGDANAEERWLRRREVYLPKGVPLGHYSPTNLFTGSTIPAAIGHAQCGKVTPRGSRLAGIVKCSKSPRLRRGINSIHKKKRTSALTEVLFVKSGDDLLSHKCLQYHRRCWA